ncbi:hypothetical protein L5515_004929 [Caenorhabditis briggsae]|uniref:Uncharacterized protein n=1 Tax=Caenorhabditis briggsae TaxID=6238 RepID=A0AAE9JE75_CAEBR|nr:hypothetical protein L5515_004929 [Caenorhabditis briggsae]
MSTMSEYSFSSPSQSIGVRQIVIGTLPSMQKRKIDENAQNTSVTRFKPTLVSLPKADFKALLEVPEVKEVLEASRSPPKKGYLIKNNEIEWFIKSDNEIRQLAKFSILDLNTGRIICYWMPSAIDEVSRSHLEAPEPSPIAQKRVSFDGAGPSPKIQNMNPPAETEVITLEDEVPLSYVPISLNNDQLTHWLIKIERILIDQKESYERKLIDQHEMFEQKLMEQQAMYEQRFEKMEELIQRNHGDVIQIGNDDRSRVNHELASIRSDMVIREKSPQPTMAETLAAMKKAAKRKRK